MFVKFSGPRIFSVLNSSELIYKHSGMFLILEDQDGMSPVALLQEPRMKFSELSVVLGVNGVLVWSQTLGIVYTSILTHPTGRIKILKGTHQMPAELLGPFLS